MIKLIESRITCESYDDELVQIANKTSRTKGASAVNADGTPRSLVARYILSTANKQASILDFGAGRDAVQTQYLKDQGFSNVTAYDFGSNVIDGLHDANALSKKYDIVFASNVLNVSSTIEMLQNTIRDIWSAVKIGGAGIFNYPSSPRKAGLKVQEVATIIEDITGVMPIRVAGSSSAPVWQIDR